MKPPRPALQLIQVFNRQRKHRLDLSYLRWVAGHVLEQAKLAGHEVCIVFVSDRTMKRLNAVYRGMRKTTDVLSFANPGIQGYLGDVFISTETAAAKARVAGHSLLRESAFLILHGILHLAGYDHETDGGQMRRLERRLRRAAIFCI